MNSSSLSITNKCPCLGKGLAIMIQIHKGRKFLGLYSLLVTPPPHDCYHTTQSCYHGFGEVVRGRPFFKTSCMPKDGTVNYLGQAAAASSKKQPGKRVGGVEKHFRGLGKEGGQDQQRGVRRERSQATQYTNKQLLGGRNENKRQEGRK